MLLKIINPKGVSWKKQSDLNLLFSFDLSKSASLVAQRLKRLPGMWETRVRSLGREDPLEKELATHSSTLAGKPHGQRSQVSYSPWGHKRITHDLVTKHTNILCL